MVTSTNHDTLSFPTTSTTDVSFMSMPPHAIYFPVAFHDSALSHMQVVGYPQVIIPVALNRSTAHLYQPSLLVDETLSHGIQIPSSLNVGNTTIKVDKMNYPTTSRPETTTNVDSQNSTRELEKRYRCECGVSFNSETTLEGHRKYYCNSVANHAEINREPQKKALNRCQQCEFQPASANQLAQHIRANHSAIRAYVCRICGYKGYSQRGIRSHLRTHSQCSNSHHEDLIKMHVYVVTPELVKFECSECHKTFPTKQQMKEHNCEDSLNSEPL
ncbi:unnamed protein product [Anisakis simplex]|uniref:C2H2-type domain-containing protein n=1 Tax=Anisakis simplex TaxID=6269 RepID=A0A0M3K651_ANISI|nr:unnamed protein product [Anisakis simplex]